MKEKMTIRSVYEYTVKSIKMCAAADKGAMLRESFDNVICLFEEFLDVIMIKLIINGMSTGKTFREMLLMVVVFLILEYISGLTRDLICRRKKCHSQRLDQNLRNILNDKVLHMDYANIENPAFQEKRSRAYDNLFGQFGIKEVIGVTAWQLHNTVKVIVSIVMIIPYVITGSNRSGFAGFICSPLGFLCFLGAVIAAEMLKVFWMKKVNVLYENLRQDPETIRAEMTSKRFFYGIVDNYRSGKEIRIFGERGLILNKRQHYFDVFLSKWNIGYKKTAGYWIVQRVAVFVSTLLRYGYAILRAIYGGLLPGDVIAFVLLFLKVSDGIFSLTDNTVSFRMIAQNSKYVFDFLDTPDEQYKGTIPTEKRNDNEYEFEFKHVWFKYPNTEQYVLRDVNMKWRIGEKMALVGRNGCGKSTLVKLLCRLYDPTKGEITLNGIDIRKYDYDDYMALFSVVFQDSSLFAFSLAENVAASTEYDADKVEDSVRRSGLSERLDTLPEGINTYLYKEFDEHGVEISGGEAQKLCLARAIYKGAPFIVLDEPTAALDPISEHDIYTKFNGIVGTRTAIYISHRLSSCRFCDEITVMDNGEIVERGSHDMLVTAGGHYAQLWSAQAEYYRDTAGELFE